MVMSNGVLRLKHESRTQGTSIGNGDPDGAGTGVSTGIFKKMGETKKLKKQILYEGGKGKIKSPPGFCR